MCDTFVALPVATRDGSVIFGKNSDREPNEAQALEHYRAGHYPAKAKLRCTYLEIFQAKETYAVILNRPFWMWGAKMGANEKGVVIGNEAVWSKMPINKKQGLTGMDLLRLALERAPSAASALETIVGLLSDHGQGGICGYEDKHMAYHNSFIIADPTEAWVLETAGPLWAALKVKDVYAISNGLTIGEDYDECHPELITFAVKKGWHKKGTDFHFARSYAAWLYTTFSASHARQKRSHQILRRSIGDITIQKAISILRDHQGDGYQPDAHLLGNRICAHAANRLFRSATQTVGSLAAHIKPDLQTYWMTGTSSPCIGIFKPIWFEGGVLPDIGPVPEGVYNADTLWWHHERLYRSVIADFQHRYESIRSKRRLLEDTRFKQVETSTFKNRWSMTQQAFQQARQQTDEWIETVSGLPVRRSTRYFYRGFWARQNRKAKINLP